MPVAEGWWSAAKTALAKYWNDCRDRRWYDHGIGVLVGGCWGFTWLGAGIKKLLQGIDTTQTWIGDALTYLSPEVAGVATSGALTTGLLGTIAGGAFAYTTLTTGGIARDLRRRYRTKAATRETVPRQRHRWAKAMGVGGATAVGVTVAIIAAGGTMTGMAITAMLATGVAAGCSDFLDRKGWWGHLTAVFDERDQTIRRNAEKAEREAEQRRVEAAYERTNEVLSELQNENVILVKERNQAHQAMQNAHRAERQIHHRLRAAAGDSLTMELVGPDGDAIIMYPINGKEVAVPRRRSRGERAAEQARMDRAKAFWQSLIGNPGGPGIKSEIMQQLVPHRSGKAYVYERESWPTLIRAAAQAKADRKRARAARTETKSIQPAETDQESENRLG